jgi:hypothetical protein
MEVLGKYMEVLGKYMEVHGSIREVHGSTWKYSVLLCIEKLNKPTKRYRIELYVERCSF